MLEDIPNIPECFARPEEKLIQISKVQNILYTKRRHWCSKSIATLAIHALRWQKKVTSNWHNAMLLHNFAFWTPSFLNVIVTW